MCHPRYGCHKNEVLGGVAIFERGQHETGEDSVKTSAWVKVQVWVKNVIGLSPKSLDGTTIDELLL